MDEGRTVSRAAVEQAVTTLVYIGIMLAASWALAHRDELTRAAMRVERWLGSSALPAEPDGKALAQLHRDIHRLEGKEP